MYVIEITAFLSKFLKSVGVVVNFKQSVKSVKLHKNTADHKLIIYTE